MFQIKGSEIDMTTKCKANPRLNLALEEKNAIDDIVRSTDKTKYVWIDKIMKSIVVLWLWKRICLFLGNNKLNYLGIKSHTLSNLPWNSWGEKKENIYTNTHTYTKKKTEKKEWENDKARGTMLTIAELFLIGF